jgi:hypothetical protein
MPAIDKTLRRFEKSMPPHRRQEWRDASRTWMAPTLDRLKTLVTGGKSLNQAIDILLAETPEPTDRTK